MFPPAILLPLLETLRSSTRGVMAALGNRVARAPAMWPPLYKLIPEPLVVRVNGWLQKRHQMIEALMHRIAAGTHILRPYKALSPKPGAVPKPRGPAPPEQALRREIGWISHMASEVAPYLAALIWLLNDTEMKAMVLASPQMARLWAPMMNALGLPRPDWWPKPPPRPRRARKSRPRTRKPVIAGRDPAISSSPANASLWQPAAGAPPPPQRYASDPPRPPGPITSWRDFLDSVRPVSLSFEPPVVDDPVPYGLPGWSGVQLPPRKPRW